MAPRDRFFHNLGYYTLLYLPLAGVAFYMTYFSAIDEQPVLAHVHFGVMVLWLGLSVAQPLLIRYGRLSMHRQLGRMSYVVMPLVVITGYLMLRSGAFREWNLLRDQVTNGTLLLSNQEVLNRVYDFALLGTPYLLWPALFYGLAMIHRGNMVFHSRYMLAAILTVTGPIVDRILFLPLGLTAVGPIPAETIAFLVVDGILLMLAVYDHRQGKTIKPVLVALAIYLTGQIGYFLMQKSSAWYTLAEAFLQLD